MDTELIIDSGKNENNNQKKRTHGMRFFAFFQRNWSWLVPALVVFIVMLILTILSDVAPFGGNSLSSIDSMHQYVPFFSDFQRKLQMIYQRISGMTVIRTAISAVKTTEKKCLKL